MKQMKKVAHGHFFICPFQEGGPEDFNIGLVKVVGLAVFLGTGEKTADDGPGGVLSLYSGQMPGQVVGKSW